VAVPVFENIIEAAWDSGVQKTRLSAPSDVAMAVLKCDRSGSSRLPDCYRRDPDRKVARKSRKHRSEEARERSNEKRESSTEKGSTERRQRASSDDDDKASDTPRRRTKSAARPKRSVTNSQAAARRDWNGRDWNSRDWNSWGQYNGRGQEPRSVWSRTPSQQGFFGQW
jgi:hypothetical protein